VAEDSLEPLITQCPTCRTRFRVTESQLNVAAGRVRCGACLSVFAGLENLVVGSGPRLKPGESANEALDALLDELRTDPVPKAPRQNRAQPPATARAESTDAMPQAGRASAEVLANSKPDAQREPGVPAATESDGAARATVAPESAPRRDPDAPTPAVDPVSARRARRLRLAASSAAKPSEPDAAAAPVGAVPAPAPVAAEADESGAVASVEIGSPAAEATTETARPVAAAALDLSPEDLMERPRRRRRWWMPILLLLGLTGLTAQVLYFQFDAWAKNPDIRPVYEWICPQLHCTLPVMRSIDEIRSKNLVVRANPDVPGELMVDAIIVNQARFAQPFPVIELRFSSMDGRPIAARRFKPEEYLAGELKGATMFAPLTPVHIALAIEDPGTEAVSYYVQFR
jgi:predicted Zn finger-like uncharacterized protein